MKRYEIRGTRYELNLLGLCPHKPKRGSKIAFFIKDKNTLFVVIVGL